MPKDLGLLIKRLRFQQSLSQLQLAEILGVDQTAVSRWERDKIQPDVDIQKRIRDMLRRYDPSISIEGIEMLPTITAVVDQSDISVVKAISKRAARAYNLTPAEAIVSDWKQILPHSILEAYTNIMEHPAWSSGEAAGYETILKRGDDCWHRCVGLIVGPSRLVHWHASPTDAPSNPNTEIVKWKLITLDELVST